MFRAILTILQIESAANDPFTRYSALLSMVCALMSLFYGCIYIIQFGTMRKVHKAAEWAQVSIYMTCPARIHLTFFQEARTSSTGIFWNVWVFLAMPATWLAWQVFFQPLRYGVDLLNISSSRSMIMYIVCITSFVWRTGTTDDADRGLMTPENAFPFRIIVTVVLSLGLLYFFLIASTLRRYGEMMDQTWHRRIVGWINETVAPAPYSAAGSGHIPTTPFPSADPPASVTKYPQAESGFGHPTIRSKSSSARSHIPRSSSKPALRPPTPHTEFSFSNIVREHDYGVDNKHDAIISKMASVDQNMGHDLKTPIDASPPPPPFSPPSVLTPAHPLHLIEAIPHEVYHEMVLNHNLFQGPIKLARVLLLASEGDHPALDVPPSEDELKACHMTKELWKELQTVSVIFP